MFQTFLLPVNKGGQGVSFEFKFHLKVSRYVCFNHDTYIMIGYGAGPWLRSVPRRLSRYVTLDRCFQVNTAEIFFIVLNSSTHIEFIGYFYYIHQ